MKTFLIFLSIFFIALNAKCQNEADFQKIIIRDVREKGLDYYDTVTTDHRIREVFVDRGLTARTNKYANLGCDTCNFYRIGFMNTYNSKPHKFSIMHVGNEVFETALYRWTSDSTVAVTLYQSNVILCKEYKIGFRDDHCILYGATDK